MKIHHSRVPKADVFRLLSNERHRHALEYLTEREQTTVSELVAAVAASECHGDTAPEAVRTAVYVSLRQIHLPRLAEAGLIDYDSDTNQIRLLKRARGVTVYLELVAGLGLTWAEWYQYLGIGGLIAVLASLLGVPGIAAVPPIAWTTLFLVGFAAVSAYQIWSAHWHHTRGAR